MAISPASKLHRMNEQITARQVRLVESKGDLAGDKANEVKPGLMSIEEALSQAKALGLDLVEVSPNAEPPVVQIMNFGKFKFLKKKTTKKPKPFKVKEIKLRPVTDEGDYRVKLRNLLGFLEHGDKVKVTVRFRGREISHHDLGERLLDRIEKDVGEVGVIEQRAKMEGRQLIMTLAPRKLATMAGAAQNKPTPSVGEDA